jgi:hypothetical protein
MVLPKAEEDLHAFGVQLSLVDKPDIVTTQFNYLGVIKLEVFSLELNKCWSIA